MWRGQKPQNEIQVVWHLSKSDSEASFSLDLLAINTKKPDPSNEEPDCQEMGKMLS